MALWLAAWKLTNMIHTYLGYVAEAFPRVTPHTHTHTHTHTQIYLIPSIIVIVQNSQTKKKAKKISIQSIYTIQQLFCVPHSKSQYQFIQKPTNNTPLHSFIRHHSFNHSNAIEPHINKFESRSRSVDICTSWTAFDQIPSFPF